MINYKKTYKESTSWRHWRLSCSIQFRSVYCRLKAEFALTSILYLVVMNALIT